MKGFRGGSYNSFPLSKMLFFSKTFSVESQNKDYSNGEGTNSRSPTEYHHSMNSIFRDCLLSFCFDLIGLLAGLTIASQLNLFQFSPWIIAVYPAVLSVKGIIVGMLTGRLGTALHVGTIYPRFTRNTKDFYRLFDAIVVVTLIASLLMGSIAMLFGSLLWGVEVGSTPEILLNVMATMALGITISILTMLVSFSSFKRGFDPDVVAYPVMSSTADVIITIYYITVVGMFFFLGNLGKSIVTAISVLYFILTLFTIIRNVHNQEFIRDIKEILLTLIVVAFIVNATGTFLSRIGAVVEEKREVYTAYPAVIDMIGDVGSVIGSVSTTRLTLGLISPSIRDIRRIKEHLFSSWISSLIIFVTLSFAALMLTGVFNLPAFAAFTLILVTANIIAVPTIIFVAFFVSILTFKYGFNPDNFVIPIESSLADTVATVALLLSLILHS